MSLLIRRIALENFRKFRAPHEIAGLTQGLNIVIEPNETGKSTPPATAPRWNGRLQCRPGRLRRVSSLPH